MKDRYLSEKVRNAIRQKHQHNTLFLFAETLAQQAEEAAGEHLFALSGEDLYYLTAKYLDRLLDIDDPHGIQAKYRAENLWGKIKLEVRDKRNPSASECDWASALVALLVRECLRNCDAWRYWDVCDEIRQGIVEHFDDEARWLRDIVTPYFMRADVQKYLQVWWEQYTESDSWLSDELEELLFEVDKGDEVVDIPHKAMMVEALKPYFWDNVNKVELFLRQIYHKPDDEVGSVIRRLRRLKEIDLNRNVKAFHSLLVELQLYHATYDNLSKQVRD